MSGVSSSNSDFQGYQATLTDYQRQIREQADEADAERAKTKTKNEEKVESVYRKNEENLKALQGRHESAMDTVRLSTRETIENQRKQADESVRSAKEQYYDRAGRMRDEVMRAQDENRRINEAWTLQDQQNHEVIKRVERNSEEKLGEIHRKAGEDKEQAVRKAVENIRDFDEDRREKALSGDYNYRRQVEDKYRALEQRRTVDVDLERKELMHLLESERKAADQAKHATNRANERRIQDMSTSMNEYAKAQINTAHQQSLEENTDLRNQLRSVSQLENEVQKARANARHDAIHEFEGEYRARENVIQRSMGAETEKAKADAVEGEARLSRNHSRNLQEKEIQFANRMRDQISERANDRSQMREQFEVAEQNMRAQIDHERKLSEAANDRQFKASEAARQEALDVQAKAYNHTFRNAKTQSDEEIQQLQRRLFVKETSADPKEMSPAAEQTLRAQITEAYEKQIGEDKARRDRDRDSLYSTYSKNVFEVQRDSEQKLTQLNQATTIQHERDRRDLGNLSTELETSRTKALEAQDRDHQRQVELMVRNFAEASETQRRKYEELLNNIKTDSDARFALIRQENEFQSRMTERKHAVDQTFIARENEKKLADQKAMYEDAIKELTNETEKRVRDVEKEKRQELTQLSRSYEQRLLEQEAQVKERERTMAANFEDQLSRVRETNARLIQKKS